MAYLLAPSDVTWWLGQLTAVPAVGLAAYFREPPSDSRHFDTTSGDAWAPPDGGGV